MFVGGLKLMERIWIRVKIMHNHHQNYRGDEHWYGAKNPQQQGDSKV